MVKVYDNDTYNEMALKIFKDFEIGQSCMILGFEQIEAYGGYRMVPKGELVCDSIRELYKSHFMKSHGKKLQRIRIIPKNTIGGFKAHPMFTFKMERLENNIKYTIWRTQ